MNPEIDMSDVVLKTERLILRPWRTTDLDDLFDYASVPGVGEMAGWEHHADKRVSQMILNTFIEGKKTFALEYHGRVIGSLGIEKYREDRFPEFADKCCREIGFVLGKSYWGRGLMPEAVREVLRWLFEDLHLDTVFCGHFLRNQRSARVQEKCGFQHYAFGKYETQLGTVEEDEIEILTRDEWAASRVRILPDMTVPCGDGLLNIRVGAVIMKDGKFLMAGNARDDYLYSVGGRIKFGETAEEAIIREVREETGVEMKADRLAFIHENYFIGSAPEQFRKKQIYELCFYFYMQVPENFEPVCRSSTSDGLNEFMKWVVPGEPQKLYPDFFRTELLHPEHTVKHFVSDGRDRGHE